MGKNVSVAIDDFSRKVEFVRKQIFENRRFTKKHFEKMSAKLCCTKLFQTDTLKRERKFHKIGVRVCLFQIQLASAHARNVDSSAAAALQSTSSYFPNKPRPLPPLHFYTIVMGLFIAMYGVNT